MAGVTWTANFDFGPMARVVFGVDRARDAGRIVRELNGTAALLMTDPTLHRLGITEPIEAALGSAEVRAELFTNVATEPMLESVEAAVDMFRERDCDVIVAVGGGSSMDSAKAVSLLVGNGGLDYTNGTIGTELSEPHVGPQGSCDHDGADDDGGAE
jgi:alcohol dehydrogenase class IV